MNNKGFSLIELLGIVVILAVLSSVTIIAFGRYKQRALDNSYEFLSSSSSSAAEEYFMDYPTEDSISLENLKEDGYLESIGDPKIRDAICTGEVSRKKLDGSDDAIVMYSYKVDISCSESHYSSCKVYSDSDVRNCGPGD